MLSVNNEITQLVSDNLEKDEIVKAKLSQLKRLSVSIVFQYVAVLLFLLAGVIAAVFSDLEFLSKGSLITGVLSLSSSIVIMLIYSVKAVSIRQKH
jgi:uncharacterized membrane protein